jgi:hypothetical protein
VPDAVGFLLLKTAVGHYREDPKDAYDIYSTVAIPKTPSRSAKCWPKPSASRQSREPYKI